MQRQHAAFARPVKLTGGLIPSAVTDALDVIQNVTAVEYRHRLTKGECLHFRGAGGHSFHRWLRCFSSFCSSVKLQNGGCQRGADTGGEWLILTGRAWSPGQVGVAGFLAAAGLIRGAASAAGHGLADSHKRAGDVGGADVIFQTATADDVFCL